MKTIALLAVLFASSAFAAPGFEQKDLDRDLAKAQAYADRMQSAPLNHLWEATKADPSAYQSSKVDYSRTILPSGQTISTTTWK
jgi:hypothetical protein